MITNDMTPLADPANDDVAVAVQNAFPGANPTVIRFSGYLGDGPSMSTSRLYTHPHFHTWYEISDSDIVAQAKTMDQNGGSYIWVKRYANIVRCQAAQAVDFAMRDEDQDATEYPRRP